MALGRAFTSETGVRVTVQADHEARLPLRSEAELYRIAQEALANVRKHARATEVQIELRASRRGTLLTIVDNGTGFDRARPTDGSGVLGMRERARLLGGRLRIASRPGGGTKISVQAPAEREAEG
jgi:signal transduction histidine kinase